MPAPLLRSEVEWCGRGWCPAFLSVPLPRRRCQRSVPGVPHRGNLGESSTGISGGRHSCPPKGPAGRQPYARRLGSADKSVCATEAGQPPRDAFSMEPDARGVSPQVSGRKRSDNSGGGHSCPPNYLEPAEGSSVCVCPVSSCSPIRDERFLCPTSARRTARAMREQ
jgi:hypothetical protein